jgi:hypothetical protein
VGATPGLTRTTRATRSRTPPTPGAAQQCGGYGAYGVGAAPTCHELGSPVSCTRHPNLRSLVTGAVLVTLAACGSSASTTQSPVSTVPSASVTSATTSTAASTATTPTPTTASGGAATTAHGGAGSSSDCGDAAVAVDKAIGSSTDVTDIKVIGGCMVSVSTGLQAGSAGAGAAQDLCDQAADAAYAAGAKSLSINSITKTELAIGIKGSPCIGEP